MHLEIARQLLDNLNRSWIMDENVSALRFFRSMLVGGMREVLDSEFCSARKPLMSLDVTFLSASAAKTSLPATN